MAKKQGKVYLGYEDEIFNDRNQTLVNYTVNKIGGFPDWPPLEQVPSPPKCPHCGLHRLLVVQCYAPIEGSVYHRTLYVFACISPNCWAQYDSWVCFRSQIQDNSSASSTKTTVAMPSSDSNLAWCNGADEWDENDNGDTENGNVMNVDNAPGPLEAVQRLSDEDEESNSFEVETVEQALGNLRVFDAHNANMSPVQGAEGGAMVAAAAAELEGGDEPGLVSVDTPTQPQTDLLALMQQASELPVDVRSRLACAPMQFVPKFVYVEEELVRSKAYDDRVTELLNKYKRDNEMENVGAGAGGGEDDVYEEAAPHHGDRLFHAFVTRLRESPGQILRYTRDAPPLLGAPLPAPSPPAPTCPRCNSHLICELQLLPSFADTLKLNNVTFSHLHFLSVLVFTCAQSCWQTGDVAVKETIVFQPEV